MISVTDLIDTVAFAKMKKITMRTLRYRLRVGHIKPMPEKFKGILLFESDAEIVIPPPIRAGGRPIGSTVAKGAKSPGRWADQKPPKLGEKRGRKIKVK